MANMNERIQRIDSYYVGNDCVQVMFPFRDTISIISQNGILFHYKPGSSVYVNKYLEDERREQFPYSNIPMHYARIRGKKYTYTNQLLDFDKPYINILDGSIEENYVVKDNNEALLVTNVNEAVNYHTVHMTFEEFLRYTSKHDESNKENNEQVYYLNLNGGLYDYDTILKSKERIHYYIRNNYFNTINRIEKRLNSYDDGNIPHIGRYLLENSWLIEYLKKSINEIDFSLVDFNIKMFNDFLILRINDDDIKIELIDVTFVKDDDYKVDIQEIPVTKYTLEQLKFATKIMGAKNPKIPLKLNPGVTKQDLTEAEEMVRKLKK